MLGDQSAQLSFAHKKSPAFSTGYGPSINVFDQYDGNLQSGGETLSLIKPGTNAASNLTVAKVRYSDAAPWPVSAVPLGSSFQLVDSSVIIGGGQLEPLPQWFMSPRRACPSSTLYIYLQSAGDTYLDDIKLVPGNVAEAGTNILARSDFESSFPGLFWHVSTNLSGSGPDLAIKHSGNASLHVVSTSAGSSQGLPSGKPRQPGSN